MGTKNDVDPRVEYVVGVLAELCARGRKENTDGNAPIVELPAFDKLRISP